MEPGHTQVKSPSQLQPPREVSAKIPEIAWGEPTNSIRCGLSLHKAKARYSLGEEIHFTFHAQNQGTRKTELPQFALVRETDELFKIYDVPWPLTDDFVPIFTDSAGKRIKGVWNTSKYKYDYHKTREIESQQSLALGGIDWHLDTLHLRGVDLKPGKYTVHFENLLLGQHSSTGKIPIDVVEAAKEPPASLTAWGKAVEGIEYGIAFMDNRNSYRIGEHVSFVLKARNVSEKNTSFNFVDTLESPAFGMEIGAAPLLEDANGKKVHVGRCAVGWTLAVYKERNVTLEPGQTIIFGETRFTLGDAYEPHILAEPGTLKVRYDSFALWYLKEQPTGTLKLQVEPAKDLP